MEKEVIVNIPNRINIDIGIPGRKGDTGLPGKDGKSITFDDLTEVQKAALKGPKGDKGEDGNPGAPGSPGKDFKYEDFTPDQLLQLKGPKGDKGDPLRFEDLTPDQIAQLKGPKGDPGTGGSSGGNVDLSAYPTKQEAENLYLKKVDLRNYLTMLGDPKYALKTDLNNYMQTTAIRDTFVSRVYADNTYAKKTDFNNYMTTAAIKDTFVSRIFADNNYATKANLNSYISKADVDTTYSKKTDLNNYLTATAAADAYLSKTDAESAYAKKTDLDNYVTKANAVTNNGDTASVHRTAYFLRKNYVNLPNDDLDTVLYEFLNYAKPFLFVNFETLNTNTPFNIDEYSEGDTFITAHGYNHFKVQVNNGNPVEIINNIATIPIEDSDSDEITVKYINLVGETEITKTIQKHKESEEDNNAPEVPYNMGVYKLIVKGKKAKLSVASATSFIATTTKEMHEAFKALTINELIIDLAVKNSYLLFSALTLDFIPKKIRIINSENRESFNIKFSGNADYNTKVYINDELKTSDRLSNGTLKVKAGNAEIIGMV
nr:MAG TPA: collagen triple helix repeat protein [Caudoviricetes sp.]